MTAKSSHFPPTDTILEWPVGFATGIVIGGLTAPQMRLALVLVALARVDGGVVLEKPVLERLAGITLSNAGKLLQPLLDRAVIEQPGAGDKAFAGHPVFSELQYTPGKHKVQVGEIRARLSPAMQYALGDGRNVKVRIPADELRGYGRVASILLRLHLGAMLALNKTAASTRLRFTGVDIDEVFGSYGRVARIERPTVDGVVKTLVSLSRASSTLVEPAVVEINATSIGVRMTTTHMVDGDGARRPWTHLDIVAHRLHPAKPKRLGEMTKGSSIGALPRRVLVPPTAKSAGR